jgi:peptide/nickel transport system substrate-binding protein
MREESSFDTVDAMSLESHDPRRSHPPTPFPSLSRRHLLQASAGSGLALAGTAALAGCGPAGTVDGIPPLRIHANDVTTYAPNFNPFSPTSLQGATGLIFEPFMIYTAMDPENPTPWLAEKIEFSEDGTGADITLRTDATWTDGEPLTVEDAVFSLLLLRDEPATNGQALPVADAKKTGENTLRVEFEGPSFAFAPTLGNTYVVPQHVFDGQDPLTLEVPDPIGSGPYKLNRFSDQLYTFVRNDEHWAADEFEPPELYFPSYTSATFNTALQAGEIDWSGGFVANVEKIFVSHDPEHRGYYYPGLGVVNLTFNLEKELWQDIELRRGISLAIDRQQIADIAMLGYVPPPHPTGLPRPTFEQYISEEYQGVEFEFDPDKAGQVLDDAGYAKGEDGIRVAPSGERLEYTLQIPSGWVDWISVCQVLDEQLTAIGVKFSPQGISLESWTEKRNAGNFDVTLSTVSAGQSPWFMYRSWLSSEHRSDEGTVLANFQRWYDEATDEQLQAFTETDDEKTQQACIDAIEKIVVEQLPSLPVVTAPNWFNYNTEYWTGFPSPENSYALGAPYSPVDRVLVLRELTRNDSGAEAGR